MAAVETIAIVSEDDPSKMVIINLADFDAAKHTKWEDRDKHPATMAKPEEFSLGSAHKPEMSADPKFDKPGMSSSKK